MEVTLISVSCSVYKIISRDFNGGENGFLQINTQDKKQNKMTFTISAEIIDGLPKNIITIIDYKNNITTKLRVDEKSVF